MVIEARALSFSLGLVVLAATPVRAETPAGQVAQEAALLVYQEGRSLFLTGEHAEALVRFEAAFRVVQNDSLRYYLGRAYAELGRCPEALPMLLAVAGKVGAGSDGEGEGRRAKDEAVCRLVVSREHLEAWRCQDAAAQLAGLVAKNLGDRKAQAEAARLTEAARSCVADFDTTDEAGRVAASRHAEARAALAAKRGERALALARSSTAARPSLPARVVAGLALESLGQCDDAIDVLEAVAPWAAVDDRTSVERSLTRCRLKLARAHVEAERCAEAMPLLEALSGSVRGADENWRADKESWCRPRSTAFLTDTAMRKAAYKLFVAGREAVESGEAARAVGIYDQALGFSDEPVIRRHLAAAHFALGDCAKVFEALQGVPEGHRTASDRARMAGCGPYSPTATLAPDALRRRVLAVERLLSERERGRAAAALSQAQALGRVTNPKLAALVTDLYYEAGECEAYLARVDAATQGERLRLADAAPRTATCRARVDSDDERADTPPASDLAPVADPSPEPTIAASSSTSSGYVVAGWVTLAGGVALLGTGGAFWGLSSAASGDADEAAETWNDPAASSAARAAAWSERQRLSDDATQHQVTAWIMGGLGAAALVTGVILLVTAPGDDEAPVAPTVGLTSVGLRGRF